MRHYVPVHIVAATSTQIASKRDSLYPNVPPTPPSNNPEADGEDISMVNKSGRATNSAKDRPQQSNAII